MRACAIKENTASEKANDQPKGKQKLQYKLPYLRKGGLFIIMKMLLMEPAR